jgi:two-component system response regulator CpxR
MSPVALSSPVANSQPFRWILLIEDDTQLCSLMTKYFARYGFRILAVHDGKAGLATALERAFDFIILDVMLPAMEGFDVLRQIRKNAATPVIMLTARASHGDRVKGLELGADDYLPKPFAPEELLARIRAVLRRSSKTGPIEPQIIEAGDLEINTQTREVRCGGSELELTSIEYIVLEILMQSGGRVVTRDELTLLLYQRPATPYERSLDVHICHLRKKLENKAAVTIRNIRGVGYHFAVRTDSR